MTRSEDADKRFAHRLFTAAADDDEDQDVDDAQEQRDDADDGLDEQRRFAANLFAPDDPDAPILAGLKSGRHVGRTSRPEHDDVPPNAFNFS